MEFDFQAQPGAALHHRGLRNDGQPLVSIITPFYNGGKYFEQTFNCVMNQTFPWFEWIIVDDGSTDSQDLQDLEEFASKDPRIHVYQKENGGIASARNLGIQKASTDLILPLDCDDLLEPTFVEVCWWMLQKSPDAAWSYTDSVGFSGQEYLWQHRFDPLQEKKENLLTATAIVRKRWLQKAGFYEEGHKHYNEDWVLWLKIVAKGGYPAQATNEFLFWYRRSETGVLATVKTDPDIAKSNAKLLEDAANQVKNPRPPVIYPCAFEFSYDTPVLSDWNRPIFDSKQTKRLRVAFLLPWTVMGGADKFVLDLVSGLDKERFDVGILTTLTSQNDWCQRFRTVCDDVFNLPDFMAATDYAEFISYYIKSRQLDVLVVSNTYIGIYLVPWLREKFPDLAIVDYVHMEEWYWRQGGHARTSGIMGGVLDRTYVCNSATRQVMIDHFGRSPESVVTVHIGVDEKAFDRTKVQPGQLYKETGIEPGRPVVLFICRLHPQKRPYLMLEIADSLRHRVPDVAFVVVGDGELEDGMKARTQKLGLENTVYYLGAKKEVRPYYRDAKVTLVCSLKEGLSLTAYESCAMGVPIVSSDVGGQKDLVDNTVGALIPCLQDEASSINDQHYTEEEIESYVKPLAEILTKDDVWQTMSRNARARIENGFTIQQMVDYFEKEFVRLLSDPIAVDTRHRVAASLKLTAPLASEVYISTMRAEALEATLDWEHKHRSTVGMPGESRWHWLKRKLRGAIQHIRQEGIGYTWLLFLNKIKSRCAG